MGAPSRVQGAAPRSAAVVAEPRQPAVVPETDHGSSMEQRPVEVAARIDEIGKNLNLSYEIRKKNQLGTQAGVKGIQNEDGEPFSFLNDIVAPIASGDAPPDDGILRPGTE